MDNVIFDGTSGLPLIATAVHGAGLLRLEHEGDAGAPKDGTVSFCTVSKSAGTIFSLYVDTKIVYSRFAAHLTYRFEVVDNGGTHQLYGQVFGDQVKILDSAGKSASVTNNGGYVRLVLSSFNHPTEYYSITGIIRHM